MISSTYNIEYSFLGPIDSTTGGSYRKILRKKLII